MASNKDRNDTHLAGGPGETLLATKKEVAEALKVGPTTVGRMIRDGHLEAVHLGRSCRVTWTSVLHVAKHGTAGQKSDGLGLRRIAS